jgi:hypothetical protein
MTISLDCYLASRFPANRRFIRFSLFADTLSRKFRTALDEVSVPLSDAECRTGFLPETNKAKLLFRCPFAGGSGWVRLSTGVQRTAGKCPNDSIEIAFHVIRFHQAAFSFRNRYNDSAEFEQPNQLLGISPEALWIFRV